MNFDIIGLSCQIVAAYVSKNAVPAAELPDLIGTVHGKISGLNDAGAAIPVPAQEPAVPIKKSVMPDYVICLEDGKKFKSLKRHIMTAYGLTPAQYRDKWKLPSDYPMVAPNYAASRSLLAKKMGLGRKRDAVA